jgi:DNA transformation protein
MDREHIIELFATFGPVSVRRLFGGFGIYADGTMFALASRDVIYLKADDATAAAFEREGRGPFTYAAKGGKRTVMSYWQLPDRLYDDPEELAVWARSALTVAQRGKKPRARRKRALNLSPEGRGRRAKRVG